MKSVRGLFRSSALLSLSLAATSCGLDDVVTQRQVIDPYARLCLSAPSTPAPAPGSELAAQTFAADQPIKVSVTADNCLTSCDRAKRALCSVIPNGSTLYVTSLFEWEQRDDGERCSAECRKMTAECQTGPLPAGTYTFDYQSVVQPVTLPGTLEAPCFRER